MKKIYLSIREFILKYPAVLAAYFIYGYYFISTMDFYITFKKRHLSATQIFQHFDTLFWMWGLAYLLVKIINLREHIYEHEKKTIEQEYSLNLKETQIKTLHEVMMTLKHEINNPLAIILGYIRLVGKNITNEETSKKLGEIETAAQRISSVLKEFSAVRVYETTATPVGNLVDRTTNEPQSNDIARTVDASRPEGS
jgi:signal transduction histidine kinase